MSTLALRRGPQKFLCLLLPLCALLVSSFGALAQSPVIVGYFQNWNNASAPYIRLLNVNPKYNVVDVAFATPVSTSDMTMTFVPTQQTKAEFISDLKALQAKGVKVLISVGGADAPVALNTAADKTKFVSSMEALITDYGFDGFDIDLEGPSVILNSGDTNFKSSTTPKIVNLIAATRDISTYFTSRGKTFWVTSAPETQYVQGGYGNYGGAYGGYLPVLYGLRDILTFVHVQYYNTGSQNATDGKVYGQGTADFIVAMTDMLLKGFPVAGNAANVFPALRPDQVAFGLPATNTGAAPAGGYVTPADVTKALNYLVKGTAYGGQYVLSAKYAGLRGIMTWSINWDKTQGDAFVNNAYSFFYGSGTTTPGNTPPTVSLTAPAANASYSAPASVTLTAAASDANGTVAKVEFYQGATLLGSKTASPYTYTWANVPAGTYSLTAKATDNQGAVTTSAAVSITVKAAGGTTTCSAPAWVAATAYVAGNQVSRNGNLYSAKWWTQNEDPVTNSCQYCPWALVGPCGAAKAAAINPAAPTSRAPLADLSVYPNPVRGGQLTVELGEVCAELELTVRDGQGRLVVSRRYAQAQRATLALPPSLAQGLYVLQVGTGTQLLTRKLVVE